ncbi:MAG: hypothetical protein ACFFG0_12465 [Candidatus Thorarchaeota archaeon]
MSDITGIGEIINCYTQLFIISSMYRLYNFAKDGTLINGENMEKGSNKVEMIKKSTKTEHVFPRR